MMVFTVTYLGLLLGTMPTGELKMMEKFKQSLFRPQSLKSLRLIVVSALTEA